MLIKNTLQHAFSSPQRSMIQTAKNIQAARNSEIKGLVDKALRVLDLFSFGIVMGIKNLCLRYQEYQDLKVFVSITKALLNAEQTWEGDQEQLIAKYKDHTITVKKNQETQRLEMHIDDQCIGLGYTEIEQLIHAIKTDIILSEELYLAYDDDGSFNLNDAEFLQLSFNKDDIVLTQPVKLKQEMKSQRMVVLKCEGIIYYCKEMTYTANRATPSDIAGIHPHAPRYGLRSFFTDQFSQLLGWDVIAKTKLIQYNDTWYYGLEKAKGMTGISYTTLPSSSSDAVIIKKTVELQIVDAITGQNDRHGDNYFVDPYQKTVTGIDNDQCAGFLISHPHLTVRAKELAKLDGRIEAYFKEWGVSITQEFVQDCSKASRGVWLPPILDTEMVGKIKGLSEQAITNLMLRCRFTQEEIAAGIGRLNALKNHVTVLEERQKKGFLSIIQPYQWANEAVLERLSPPGINAANICLDTTYLGRDRRLSNLPSGAI